MNNHTAAKLPDAEEDLLSFLQEAWSVDRETAIRAAIAFAAAKVAESRMGA